jgi:FKBP-type peptidyl-prolyl cis-trans isomerase 2
MENETVNKVDTQNLTKKKDFVEILFTGVSNGAVFDSNIPEDLEKLSKESKPEKTIVAIGQRMVVKGLDEALEGKELNKFYNIQVSYKDGFGERKRELVKTIPLSVFTKHKINPKPGSTFFLDNMLVRIITVSGARVITDFNNPLSGKELNYKFKITRKVTDDKEKVETFFKFFFKFLPNFEVAKGSVKVKAAKEIEPIINMSKEKFKIIMGKDLEFEEEKKKTEKPIEKEAENQDNSESK